MSADLSAMRANYNGDDDLDETWLADGWEPLLRRWVNDAVAASVKEPNAMVLATVDIEGRPSTRMVLCKGIRPEGIIFYTNYGSAKARELDATNVASATFGWPPIGRQVTVRGTAERTSVEDTAQYWSTRPRGSQLGAWASQQSLPIGSRGDLLAALEQVSVRFANAEAVPLPPNWGGYLIRPSTVEFWQGRENRLHNRIRVSRTAGGWQKERLQP